VTGPVFVRTAGEHDPHAGAVLVEAFEDFTQVRAGNVRPTGRGHRHPAPGDAAAPVQPAGRAVVGQPRDEPDLVALLGPVTTKLVLA
jgi:hypothetical protein